MEFEEAQQRLRHVTEQMRNTVTAASIAIVGQRGSTVEVAGSGVLIQMDDRGFIVTCNHVAHPEAGTPPHEPYDIMWYSAGDGQVGPVFEASLCDPQADLALCEVPLPILAHMGKTPVVENQLAHDAQDLDGDIIFIHGWPIGTPLASMYLSGYPYGTCCGDLPEGYIAEFSFAIDYPANGLLTAQGQPAAFQLPGSLSGGMVWQTHHRETQQQWTEADSRLIGIMRRWDSEYQVLVATDITRVRQLLDQAVE